MYIISARSESYDYASSSNDYNEKSHSPHKQLLCLPKVCIIWDKKIMGTRAKAKEIFIWSAWSKLGTTLLFKVLFGWLCKGHNEKSIFMLSYIYGLIACIDYLIQ